MQEEFKLNISKPSADFTQHLSIEGNDRIIFSGPFGSGKTTFLNEFFAVEENKEKYEVFHLFPVNYSVAQNGDIFELIKFDLLFELLGKGLDFEKDDFPKLMTLQMFLMSSQSEVAKTFYELIKPLFEAVSKIGKDVTTIFDSISTLYEKWKVYHIGIQKDEQADVISFLKSFTERKGGIHEEDIFTQIIQHLLQQLKDRGKKVVLIIDDLDRIDPEHIFRLLNIFAAHFDHPTYKDERNKFGFDHVMLVCDLSNIRNIFFHKYGQKVDFTGYIDKFYSKKVFDFDNIRIVSDTVGEVLKYINYCPIATTSVLRDVEFMVFLFQELIANKILSLRDLKRIWRMNYSFENKEIQCFDSKRPYSAQFNELILIDFLKSLFGEIENVKNAINRLAQINPNTIHQRFEVREFLQLCLNVSTLKLNDVHLFKNIQVYQAELYNEVIIEYKVILSLERKWNLHLQGFEYKNKARANIHTSITSINYFDLLLKAIEYAQQEKYLN